MEIFKELRELVASANSKEALDRFMNWLQGKEDKGLVGIYNRITLLKENLSALQQRYKLGHVGQEQLQVQMNIINTNLLKCISEAEAIEEPKMHSSPAFLKYNWLDYPTSYEKSAEGLAARFNNCNEGEDYKKFQILEELASIYFDNNETRLNEVEVFVKLFDSKVQNKKWEKGHLNLNFYEILIDLFGDGFPRVPHFYGIIELNSDNLFERYDIAIIMSMLKTIRKEGYKKALSRIEKYEAGDSKVLRSAYLYQYLAGQIYSKNKKYVKALEHYKEGLKCIKTISKKGNQEIEDYFNARLVEITIYRGIATIYRKDYSVNGDLGDKELALENYDKAIELFESLENKLHDENFHRGLENLEKVGADVYYSYGYFGFEEFSNTNIINTNSIIKPNYSFDSKEIDELYDRFNKSCELNEEFLAPLSRRAIMRLFDKNQYNNAASDFASVDFRLYQPKEKLDAELLLTKIWSGLALAHLADIGKSRVIIDKAELKEYTEWAFYQRDIVSRTMECHTFDLNVIDQLFKLNDTPITDENLRSIIELFNYECQKNR